MRDSEQTFHVGDIGSNPIGDANVIKGESAYLGRPAKGSLTPVSPQKSTGRWQTVDGRWVKRASQPRDRYRPVATKRFGLLKGKPLFLLVKIIGAARSRCENEKVHQFKDYGGRGIRFFHGWRGVQGAADFLDHIGKKPTKLHTLDRINNDGNYEPGNVRWATRKQQQANRRPSNAPDARTVYARIFRSDGGEP